MNTGVDHDESSSASTPNPNPNPSVPQQTKEGTSREGENIPPTSTPTNTQPHSENVNRKLAISPQPLPQVMGVPGLSSFSPYTHPPPSPPTRSISYTPPTGGKGSNSGAQLPLGGEYGLIRAMATPVGGSGVASGGGSGQLIATNPAARKRMRESGAVAPTGGGNNRLQGGEEAGGNPCSVCGKRFASVKALFGHMRSHPDRGWKGAHPPPRFRAEEEFTDLVNRPEAVAAAAQAIVAAAQAALEQVGIVQGRVRAQEVEAHGEAAEQGFAVQQQGEGQDQHEEEVAADQPQAFRLPDLNNSPPSDADP